MRGERAGLLFGETYHRPSILYRTGFLAPDPVIVVDRGDGDTTLWASALEEGRARKEARVAEVRSTFDLDIAEKVRSAGSEQESWGLVLEEVCRRHRLEAVDVDSQFPAILADHLRAHDVDVRPRTDLYQRQRRIKTHEEVAWT